MIGKGENEQDRVKDVIKEVIVLITLLGILPLISLMVIVLI